MNFQRKKREKIEISVTPLVDALLFLLFFFIVSTTFERTTQVQVKLPESGATENGQDVKRVDLVINAKGEYSLMGSDGQLHDLVSQSADGLQRALMQLSSEERQLSFVISADGKTPHQAVISALDVAGRVGFSKITFATRKQAENESHQ